MFNNTKLMLEVIQQQARTIQDLTRRNEYLDDIRVESNELITKLKRQIEDLEEKVEELEQ